MKILKYLKTTIHKVKINTSDSFFMKLEFLKQSFETSKVVKETEIDKSYIFEISSLNNIEYLEISANTNKLFIFNSLIGKTSIPINTNSLKDKKEWFFIKNKNNEISISILLSLSIDDSTNCHETNKSSSSIITLKKNHSNDNSTHDVYSIIKSPTSLNFVKPDVHKGDNSRCLNSFESLNGEEDEENEENIIVNYKLVKDKIESIQNIKNDIKQSKQSIIFMQDKFVKEKNDLENQIKIFKEEKKIFENNCSLINEKINKLNNDATNLKKEEDLFNLNKSLFSLINFNKIGSTETDVHDSLRKKYTDKIDNYINVSNNKSYINFNKDIIEIKRNNSNEKLRPRYSSPVKSLIHEVNKSVDNKKKNYKTNIIAKVKTELKSNKKIIHTNKKSIKGV